MPLISGQLPSFIGGVSQQDASIRNPGQVAAAVNMNLSPSAGAGKRPPTKFKTVLASDLPADTFFYSDIRDAREHYIIAITKNKVRVFDHVTGKEYVVVMADGSAAYLNTVGESWRSIRACSVSDYTFIVNRERVVALTADKSPGSISASVQTFQDLPKQPIIGALYQITGDPENGFDQYFVQAQSAAVFSEVGKPGVKYKIDGATMPHGLKRIPDNVNPDGFYFSFGPLEWDARAAGDDDSNPPPSFVGQTINEVFYHLDRLGFLSSANVVMSEVGYPFNFWRTTVTQLLDSDPIDVTAPVSGVASLKHAISYQKALLVFSYGTDAIFQVTGEPLLTPKSVKIDVAARYQSHPDVRPAMAGQSVFFPHDSSQTLWSIVREYFVADDLITPDAADVTGHVPAYVPGNSRCLAASADMDMAFVSHVGATGSQVFVHQFRWQGQEKVQSAWHEWQIAAVGDVTHLHAINKSLYVVAASPGGGFELLEIDLELGARELLVSKVFDVLLDRRVTLTPTYYAFGNYTDITLPYKVTDLSTLRAVKTTDWTTPAALLDLTTATLQNGGTTLRLPGNIGGKRVLIGSTYTAILEPSEQFVKDSQNGAVLIGRLQLRRMTIRFQNAGWFRCTVTPKGRDTATVSVTPPMLSTYQGRTLTDAQFLTGTPSLASGVFTFLVQSKADQVSIKFTNDSPYPAWFQSGQWEGLLVTRARA